MMAVLPSWKERVRTVPESNLESDIKSCFDRISHDWLLAHVPMDRVILQKLLKSGYTEKHVLHETTDGTPQSGIISPAPANCALDGLKRLLQGKYPAGKRLKSLGGEKPCVNLVRYAQDFVITSKSKELLEGEVKPLVERLLQEREAPVLSVRWEPKRRWMFTPRRAGVSMRWRNSCGRMSPTSWVAPFCAAIRLLSMCQAAHSMILLSFCGWIIVILPKKH